MKELARKLAGDMYDRAIEMYIGRHKADPIMIRHTIFVIVSLSCCLGAMGGRVELLAKQR